MKNIIPFFFLVLTLVVSVEARALVTISQFNASTKSFMHYKVDGINNVNFFYTAGKYVYVIDRSLLKLALFDGEKWSTVNIPMTSVSHLSVGYSSTGAKPAAWVTGCFQRDACANDDLAYFDGVNWTTYTTFTVSEIAAVGGTVWIKPATTTDTGSRHSIIYINDKNPTIVNHIYYQDKHGPVESIKLFSNKDDHHPYGFVIYGEKFPNGYDNGILSRYDNAGTEDIVLNNLNDFPANYNMSLTTYSNHNEISIFLYLGYQGGEYSWYSQDNGLTWITNSDYQDVSEYYLFTRPYWMNGTACFHRVGSTYSVLCKDYKHNNTPFHEYDFTKYVSRNTSEAMMVKPDSLAIGLDQNYYPVLLEYDFKTGAMRDYQIKDYIGRAYDFKALNKGRYLICGLANELVTKMFYFDGTTWTTYPLPMLPSKPKVCNFATNADLGTHSYSEDDNVWFYAEESKH